MSMSRFFEEFGCAQDSALQMAEQREENYEEEKLKSFESGYGAGWEDAVKAQKDAATQLASDLSQSIADLDFTLNEARSQFGQLIEPILLQVVSKLLPEMAQKTLGLHIVQELQELLTGQVADEIVIAVSPDHQTQVEEILSDCSDIRATVASDALLSPGQAQIRLGETEREIDLGAVIAGINDAIDAFFHSLKGNADG